MTGSRRPLSSTYSLYGQVLKTVTCAKYLGVDISSGLSWNPNIDRIAGSANRTLGFVRGNIRTKIPKVCEKAYNVLIRPQLEYATAMWDPHTKAPKSEPLKSCKSSVELPAVQSIILTKTPV